MSLTVKTLLRQLMERAAAPDGDEWMKQCLSLQPPDLQVVSPPAPPSILTPLFNFTAISPTDSLQMPHIWDCRIPSSSSSAIPPPSDLSISDVSAIEKRMEGPYDPPTCSVDNALHRNLFQQANSSFALPTVNQYDKTNRPSLRSSSHPSATFSIPAVSSRGRIQKP